MVFISKAFSRISRGIGAVDHLSELGSKACCRPSPRKLTAMTVMKMSRPGIDGERRGGADELLGVVEHVAPAGGWGDDAETEKREHGFEEDDAADRQREGDDDGGGDIGQDVGRHHVGGMPAPAAFAART